MKNPGRIKLICILISIFLIVQTGLISAAADAVSPCVFGHTPVVDSAVDATCTECGLSEGSHCSVCGMILNPGYEIPAVGHLIEIDSEKPATCLEDGMTEGRHCSVCSAVLLAPEVIPATGHHFDGGRLITPATETEEGLMLISCLNNPNHVVWKVLPALGAAAQAQDSVSEDPEAVSAEEAEAVPAEEPAAEEQLAEAAAEEEPVPAEEVKDPEIIIEVIEIVPEEIPLAGIFEEPSGSIGWSVINIALSIVTLLGACVMLGGAGKACNANKFLRAASIIPAAASLAAIFFSTNFAGSMSFVNSASILIGGLSAVQAALIAIGLYTAENAEQH